MKNYDKVDKYYEYKREVVAKYELFTINEINKSHNLWFENITFINCNEAVVFKVTKIKRRKKKDNVML